jgi:recombination protein RecR
MQLPQSLDKLIEALEQFSGIGYKGAHKMALEVLQFTEEEYANLDQSLRAARQNIKFCEECGFFAEARTGEDKLLCPICQNWKRHHERLCLVETAPEVLTLEKLEQYFGRYHVLQNLINPLENIFPENTTVHDLLDRRIPKILEKLREQEILELILFFRAGFESEATTLFLRDTIATRWYKDRVKITRLAQGLPMVYNPQTVDMGTLRKALEDRREISQEGLEDGS